MTDIELQLKVLADRVMLRYSEVPEFKEEEAMEYVLDSKSMHGYLDTQLIPQDKERLVLLYAMSEVASSIAFKSAHYFKFSDGEETIDKTKVAHNYRQLARDYKNDYNRERAKSVGSGFRVVGRADR